MIHRSSSQGCTYLPSYRHWNSVSGTYVSSGGCSVASRSSLVPKSSCNSAVPRNGQAAVTFTGDAGGVNGGGLVVVVAAAEVTGFVVVGTGIAVMIGLEQAA